MLKIVYEFENELIVIGCKLTWSISVHVFLIFWAMKNIVVFLRSLSFDNKRKRFKILKVNGLSDLKNVKLCKIL